jgi:hypothetical protein
MVEDIETKRSDWLSHYNVAVNADGSKMKDTEGNEIAAEFVVIDQNTGLVDKNLSIDALNNYYESTGRGKYNSNGEFEVDEKEQEKYNAGIK